MRLFRSLLPLLTLAAAAACNCDDAALQRVRDGSIVINTPADGENVANLVNFSASATSSLGVQTVSLRVGTVELKVCNAAEDATTINCDADFKVRDYAAQSVENVLTLTAVSVEADGTERQAAVNVTLAPVAVKFVQPAANGVPPMAVVRGSSPVEVTVDSIHNVELAQVVADGNTTPFTQWRAPTTSTPPLLNYKSNVSWATAIGAGEHTIKAQARAVTTDGIAVTGEATIKVNVMCGADADCPSGQRCCASSGRCNPTVGRGDDCDCDHPCPIDQGCFPGVCGELPRKCRPGCYPGGNRPGQYAERCSNEQQGGTTVPAYCAQLPPGEATTANQGGACAPIDAVPPRNVQCSITAQDCPSLRLDRNDPASAVVPHTCVPSSPKANICLPAGTLARGQTGCEYDTCGDTSRACQRGLICVSSVDQQGNVVGAARCEKQCANPIDPFTGALSGSPDCPPGQFCNTLLGPGLEEFPAGVCSSLQ